MATLRAPGARAVRCAGDATSHDAHSAQGCARGALPPARAGALRSAPAPRAHHRGAGASRRVVAAASASLALGSGGSFGGGSGGRAGGGGGGGFGDWFHRKRVPTGGMLLLAATFIAGAPRCRAAPFSYMFPKCAPRLTPLWAAADHVDELRALGRIGTDEVDAEALDPAAALAALSPAARDALVPRRVALFVEPSPFTYGAHAR